MGDAHAWRLTSLNDGRGQRSTPDPPSSQMAHKLRPKFRAWLTGSPPQLRSADHQKKGAPKRQDRLLSYLKMNPPRSRSWRMRPSVRPLSHARLSGLEVAPLRAGWASPKMMTVYPHCELIRARMETRKAVRQSGTRLGSSGASIRSLWSSRRDQSWAGLGHG